MIKNLNKNLFYKLTTQLLTTPIAKSNKLFLFSGKENPVQMVATVPTENPQPTATTPWPWTALR